jgi:hypothetical protein
MPKKRDTPPPNVEQMEFQFDTEALPTEVASFLANNVVHVQFGTPKTTPSKGTPKDQALIDRILQSAQRLKW